MNVVLQLLAGAEVVQRHVGQAVAFQRDDALVALHLAALVDGECEVALAQQLGGRGRGRAGHQGCKLLLVGPCVAAQRAFLRAIGQQHGNRAVALGLQRKAAAVFQGAGQARRECQRLAGQLRHFRRVLVPAEQGVGQGAEADQPAAHRAVRQVEWGNATRHHDVWHVRAVGIEKGGCRGHRAKIGSVPG